MKTQERDRDRNWGKSTSSCGHSQSWCDDGEKTLIALSIDINLPTQTYKQRFV